MAGATAAGSSSPWETEAGARARTRIAELRADHVDFEEIGRRLWQAGEWPSDPHKAKSAPSRQAVWQQWRRALKAIPAPALAAFRAEKMGELEELFRRAQDVADTEHYAHSNGVVVTLGGQPLRDSGPVLAAIREQRMLLAQMLVTMGANAPVQQKITMDASVQYEVVGVDVEKLK